MYKILTASADAYVTNKILNKSTRATDANTGLASTIDIFKLYDESSFDGEANPIELSRGLVKFDLSDISSLVPSALTDFSCVLKLYDVFGGQTTPSNFSLRVDPLDQSFDEGSGRDVESFDDLDVCNFITSSYSAGVEEYFGYWDDTETPTFDITSLADINTTVSGYSVTQEFETGQEDLSVDITTAITAMLATTITNNGFRVSFIQAEEQDAKTRFVKRFVSRHSNDKNKTPRLIIKYNDAATDTTDVVSYTNYQATILNLQKEYNYSDKVRLHVFVEDRNYNDVESSKVPLQNKGKLIGSSDADIGVSGATLCYSVLDASSGEIIIPFDEDATVVSYDADEMYFTLDTNSLAKGSSYNISFRLYEDTSSPPDGVYDLQYTIGEDFIFKVV
jgi:hypothetical protein